MKGLALEMIAKLMIGVVLAAVGIGLVTQFLGINLDIPGRMESAVNHVLRGSYVDSGAKVQVINSSYTSERIAKYIKTCWDTTRDTKQDRPCFALRGDFSKVVDLDVLAILKDIDPKVPSKTNITVSFSTTDMVLIYYDFSDDVIDVKG